MLCYNKKDVKENMYDIPIKLPPRFIIAPTPILGEVIEAHIEQPLMGNVGSIYNRKIWVEKLEPPTIIELATGAYEVRETPSYILVEHQYPVIPRWKHYLSEKGAIRALRTRRADYQAYGMAVKRVV